MTDQRRKGRTIRLISGIGFILCSIALLYPVISDLWNRHVEAGLIDDYNQAVESDESSQKEYEQMYEDAVSYNASIAAGTEVINGSEYEKDPVYESLLNPSGNGMIGYIEIPCIDCTEPLYHYSTDSVLDEGIGHIHGSSLPVGGENTHCVLTGHRGLPGEMLFTYLDKVETGDTFYIHVLGHTLAYQVYDIKTVLPEDVSSLKIEENKDLVTLVTCTPYGVNTHRLLVSGKRIPYDEKNVDADGYVKEQHHIIIDPAVIVFFGFVLFILLVFLIRYIRSRKAEKGERV